MIILQSLLYFMAISLSVLVLYLIGIIVRWVIDPSYRFNFNEEDMLWRIDYICRRFCTVALSLILFSIIIIVGDTLS